MKDIFELRLVLEVGMGDLIYARLAEEDIKMLEDIATREANDPRTDKLKVRLKHEIAFHSKLYEMTGNNTLKRFQSMLLPVFNYMMEVESKLGLKPESGKISHFDLIETLKSGTPSDFRKNIREHLNPHYDRL